MILTKLPSTSKRDTTTTSSLLLSRLPNIGTKPTGQLIAEFFFFLPFAKYRDQADGTPFLPACQISGPSRWDTISSRLPNIGTKPTGHHFFPLAKYRDQADGTINCMSSFSSRLPNIGTKPTGQLIACLISACEISGPSRRKTRSQTLADFMVQHSCMKTHDILTTAHKVSGW